MNDVNEKPKRARKSRVKKTEIKRTTYKTPGVRQEVRDVYLGTTSGLTLSTMYNYNPAAVEQAQQDYLRKLDRAVARP